MGDEELFADVERLNQAEYRAFWIRMLDTKVHLEELESGSGGVAAVQTGHEGLEHPAVAVRTAYSLSNAISRRQERFDNPVSGA